MARATARCSSGWRPRAGSRRLRRRTWSGSTASARASACRTRTGPRRPTRSPPAYSSLRHRFAGRQLQGGGGWTRLQGWAWARRSAPTRLAATGPRPRRGGGRGPPPGAAAADVGAPQAGNGAAAPAGRGPGAGLARAGCDRCRAERLARPVPGGGRGIAEEPAGGHTGRGDRPAAGQGRRAADDGRDPRGEDRASGGAAPFGPPEAEVMSRQISPSTDKVYGLERVTRLWGVSRATVYRHRHGSDRTAPKRPGPLGAMLDEDLVGEIRKLLAASPFHGEGHRKLWARLRFAGIRTSRRRVLRVMRENRLLAHQRAGRPRGSRAHDGTITTERVDVMWGSDLTSVMTGEGQAAVFVAVDHCSAECVGIHASRSA